MLDLTQQDAVFAMLLGLETHGWIASLWLVALFVISLAYGVHLLRTSDYTPWEKCLYLPTYLLGRLLWRVHFTNNPPAEISSGAVLVANHRSSVDPFFVQLAARRRVHWMVAREFCNHFLFGKLLKLLQVIPTNRSGTDTASTKAAIRLTRTGRLVGMFPEGRINLSENLLLPLRSGAAVVANRANVPMIPLLIEGSPYRSPIVWSPLFMPAHVRITFGKPILPSQVNGDLPPREVSLPTPAASNPTQWDSTLFGGRSARDQQRWIADTMIRDWGRCMVHLAGHDAFPIQFASAKSRLLQHADADEETSSGLVHK